MASASTVDERFDEVTSDILAVFIFYVWMFGILAVSNLSGLENRFGAINPVVMFTLGLLMLGFVAFRQIDTFSDLKRVLGLKVYIPGFAILSTANGIGVGVLFYSLYTGTLSSVANSQALASVAQPFYNPYTASATAFSTGETGFAIGTAVFAVLFLHAYVAVFEELYKLTMFKIITNYLNRRFGISAGPAMLFALFAVLVLWALWHFFSWDMSVMSIIFAIIYGLVFYSGYLIGNYTGIYPDTLRFETSTGLFAALSGIVIYAPVGAHWSWNVLVSLEGAGFTQSQLVTFGGSMFILSLLGMAVSKRLAGDVRTI